MLPHALLLGISFFIIWLCSGMVVKGTLSIARILKLPPFTVSLFLLGTCTSIPEIAVFIQALWLNSPEVSMGNLIGGQFLILFGVIPLLAIFTKGIRVNYPLQSRTIFLFLFVVGLPLLFLLDGTLAIWESLLSLLTYLFFLLVFSSQAKRSFVLNHDKNHNIFSSLPRIFIKMGVAILLIFIAGNRIVIDVREIASLIQIPPFLLSLLLSALGTNVPEISIAIRAVLLKSRNVALGDYVGSVTFNTLLIAMLGFLHPASFNIQGILALLVFFIIEATLFWMFTRSKKTLSPIEGLLLIGNYLLFLSYVSL